MTSVKIPDAHALAPASVTHKSDPSQLLQACSVAGMVGVLHQLGRLAEQAHEIFDGLTVEATRSAQRVTSLQERLGYATDRLARVAVLQPQRLEAQQRRLALLGAERCLPRRAPGRAQ